MTADPTIQPEMPSRATGGIGWGLLFAIWTVPAVLMALQMVAMAFLNRTPMPSAASLVPAAAEWLIWAPLTPLVLRLGRWFPLGWPPRLPMLLPHFGGVCLASLVRGLVYASATRLVVGAGLQPSFAAYTWRVSLGWLPIAGVVYAAILGIGAALDYRERIRQGELKAAELEGRLARAELEALRAHLHPHFFFNALHTVGALVRRGDGSRAVDTIAALSELLRELLRADAPEELPLEDELAFLRRYLAIVELRFGDRMRVDWRIPPETNRLVVPRMVLQPLVENAVRHGISARGDAGRLTIESALDGPTLVLRVIDDGPGPTGRPSNGTPGTGLESVRSRLRRRHGSAATVRLDPAPPRGAVATVRLPAQAAPAEPAVSAA